MTMPGPGDPETWPPPTGHPNDPRTADPDECPSCEESMIDPEGCAACGWAPPEPDYEAMMEPEPDEAREWGGVDPW